MQSGNSLIKKKNPQQSYYPEIPATNTFMIIKGGKLQCQQDPCRGCKFAKQPESETVGRGWAYCH